MITAGRAEGLAVTPPLPRGSIWCLPRHTRRLLEGRWRDYSTRDCGGTGAVTKLGQRVTMTCCLATRPPAPGGTVLR